MLLLSYFYKIKEILCLQVLLEMSYFGYLVVRKETKITISNQKTKNKET